MKTFSKFLLMLFGLGLSLFAQAQTDNTNPYVVCAGSNGEPFRVDYTENAGAGTTGSTYAWSITTAGFTGTINVNQGPGASSNHITIDWGTTPVGTYTLQVIETTNGCAGDPITLDIELTPAPTANAGADDAVCQGSTYTLSGASATNQASIAWTTSGDGTFNNVAIANPVYTPGVNDVTAGTVTLTITAAGNGTCSDATDNMVLTISTAATANAGADQTVCEGATATLTGASATNQASIAWTTSGDGTFNNAAISNPVYTPGANDITAGTVTLTMTATGNGSCSDATDAMVLTITPTPTANAGADDAVCEGSTVTLSGASATNQASIAWTTSGDGTFNNATIANPVYTPGANDITAGTVTLTMTAAGNGSCSDATDAMVLTITPAPIVDAGSNETICASDNLDLSGSTTAPTASNNGTLTWTTSGDGTFNNANALTPIYTPGANDITAGTVTLTLTAAGNGSCSNAVDNMTLTITPAPTANAGADDAVCEGSTVTLSGASATNQASIAWTTSGDGTFNNAAIANPIYTPGANDIIAGTVTLTMTAAGNGSCSDATDAMILTITPAPIVDAGSNETICASDNLDLSGSTTAPTASNNGTLTWTTSGDGTFNNANALTPIYTPGANDITAGTVTLTLTAAGNGSCSNAVDNMTLTITPAPTANAGADDAVCEGSTVTLSGASATNQASIAWTTSGDGTFNNATIANPVYTPGANDIATGTVTLTMTAAGNGSCSDATDAMVLTITPAATADAGSDETICEGDDLDLSASGSVPTASNNGGLTWTTSGTGTFNNANALTPIYTPSAADVTAGTVTLTLTATGNGSCSDAVDAITLTINAKPTTSPIFHN